MLRSIVATMLVAAAPATAPQVEITAQMEASAAGWNAGDLDRFMAVYAADAVYVADGTLLHSRAEIATRYRPSFAGGANTRGRLAFEPLALRAISPVHQLLIARWRLTGGAKEESGLTTLLWERRKEGWRIISDHSS